MITSHHKENEAQPGSRLLLDTTSENTPLYQYTRACKKKKICYLQMEPPKRKGSSAGPAYGASSFTAWNYDL